MASKIVAFRLPENLIQFIETQAVAMNKSKTAIVIEALQKVFGLPNPDLEAATVEKLQIWIAQLEAKVDVLAQQLGEFKAERVPTPPSLPDLEPVPENSREWLMVANGLAQEARMIQTSQQFQISAKLQYFVAWLEQQAATLDQMAIAYQTMEQRNHELERHNAELKNQLEQLSHESATQP